MNAVTADPSRPAPRKPWYREPWPWLLMSGPAIVVVAGIATAIVAFRGADGLVADDYYKQGLAINRELARDEAARTMQIAGDIRLQAGVARVGLRANAALPDRLTLRLVHPARASEDRVAYLARTADGLWEAPLPDMPAGRWRAIVETATWRVAAQIDTRSAEASALSPGVR